MTSHTSAIYLLKPCNYIISLSSSLSFYLFCYDGKQFPTVSVSIHEVLQSQTHLPLARVKKDVSEASQDQVKDPTPLLYFANV